VTPFEDIYKLFFDKIVQDIDFFEYGTTEEEALDIAKKRSKAYLMKSIDKLVNQCNIDIDLYNKDDLLEVFNFDLVSREKVILCDLMFEIYFEQDLVKLRIFEEFFSRKDLRVFDPNAKRRLYLESLNLIKAENKRQIKNYESRDRITGQLKGLDYTGWDD